MKEAAARIKINKLLEAAGWRFFADENGPANIQLEPRVALKAHHLNALGEDFEKAGKGFIDFLLLNERFGKERSCSSGARSPSREHRILRYNTRARCRASPAPWRRFASTTSEARRPIENVGFNSQRWKR
jgi:type I restriction enzyme R subunit